jgi:hypothetical protein
LVLSMEVGGLMLLVEHPDHNPEERRDDGHAPVYRAPTRSGRPRHAASRPVYADQARCSLLLPSPISISATKKPSGWSDGYAFVPSALGIGGVSKIYNETDIGGFSFVGKFVFAFGGR